MRLCFLAIALGVVGTVLLESGAVLALANVSRSFPTSATNIVPGSLISTETGSSNNLELANVGNGQRLVGVAVSTTQSLLAIDAGGGKVQVAISGMADVLVSTLSGDIHTGDQIVVSPVSGVGMKAGSSGMRSIGVAQSDFISTTPDATALTVKDKTGRNRQIFIGHIPVAIIIGYASVASQSQSGVLDGIQTFAATVAGHDVTIPQVALSALVAVIATTALIALTYGAIHGSLISIGRNPLARVSIYHSLLQALIMTLVIGAVAIVIIYLTLQ